MSFSFSDKGGLHMLQGGAWPPLAPSWLRACVIQSRDCNISSFQYIVQNCSGCTDNVRCGRLRGLYHTNLLHVINSNLTVHSFIHR